jgi:hypothetical protein
MQTGGRFTQRAPGAASDGSRRTVASFGDYQSAERAVDYLSDHGFPVDRTAIVARDLKLIEQADEEVADEAARLIGQMPGVPA